MTNRGDFYNPVCLGRGDEWYGRTNPNRAYSSNTGVNRIDESNRVGMQRISLCESGYTDSLLLMPTCQNLEACHLWDKLRIGRRIFIENGIIKE